MFQFKWIYPPYDEVNGPFIEAWFPLSADELAERNPANALYTSWLSGKHSAHLESSELGQILKQRKDATEKQLTSIGRFTEPYTTEMSYTFGAYSGAYRPDGSLRNQTGCHVNIHYE